MSLKIKTASSYITISIILGMVGSFIAWYYFVDFCWVLDSYIIFYHKWASFVLICLGLSVVGFGIGLSSAAFSLASVITEYLMKEKKAQEAEERRKLKEEFREELEEEIRKELEMKTRVGARV